MLFMFLAYAALIACVAIIAMKFIGYLKHPQHLRWELYPVAHEEADRVKYGKDELVEGKAARFDHRNAERFSAGSSVPACHL